MLSSNGSNSHGLSLQPWPRHRGGSPWPWLEWRSLRSPCPPNLCGHISAMVTGLANPDLQTKWIKIYPTLLSSSIPTGNKKKTSQTLQNLEAQLHPRNVPPGALKHCSCGANRGADALGQMWSYRWGSYAGGAFSVPVGDFCTKRWGDGWPKDGQNLWLRLGFWQFLTYLTQCSIFWETKNRINKGQHRSLIHGELIMT